MQNKCIDAYFDYIALDGEDDVPKSAWNKFQHASYVASAEATAFWRVLLYGNLLPRVHIGVGFLGFIMSHAEDRRSTVITLRVQPREEEMRAFLDWQMKLNAAIISFSGFLSLEFLAPSFSENGWRIVQRFANNILAKQWLESAEKQELMRGLRALKLQQDVQEQVEEECSLQHSVTEVFITHVAPQQTEAFRLWAAKIHRLEAEFPGFQAVYVQPPPVDSTEGRWITLLQFDSIENLEYWLQSTARAELLAESTSFVSSLQSNRLTSPYSGWFAAAAEGGALPAPWKQSMVVLLMLFPIVMLEMSYLMPLLKTWPAALAIFISNVISVGLLTFPCMPIASRALQWWLVPKAPREMEKSIFGCLLILLLYAAEIAFFWKRF